MEGWTLAWSFNKSRTFPWRTRFFPCIFVSKYKWNRVRLLHDTTLQHSQHGDKYLWAGYSKYDFYCNGIRQIISNAVTRTWVHLQGVDLVTFRIQYIYTTTETQCVISFAGTILLAFPRDIKQFLPGIELMHYKSYFINNPGGTKGRVLAEKSKQTNK